MKLNVFISFLLISIYLDVDLLIIVLCDRWQLHSLSVVSVGMSIDGSFLQTQNCDTVFIRLTLAEDNSWFTNK